MNKNIMKGVVASIMAVSTIMSASCSSNKSLELTIMGENLKNYTIVAPTNDSTLSVAADNLAAAIEEVTGHRLPVATTQETEYAIRLSDKSGIDETTLVDSYTISCKDKELSITADAKYAVAEGANNLISFIKGLKEDYDLTELNKTETITYQYIPATDERIRYYGVWQANKDDPTVVQSYWNYGYLQLDFTGSMIAVDFAEVDEQMTVKIDNQEKTAYYAGNVIAFPVANGKHTLKIEASNEGKVRHIRGFYVATDSVCTPTEKKEYYLQCIGDSISYPYTSYTYQLPQMMDWDYSLMSFCGIALRDTWGWYPMQEGATSRMGMESMYFNLEFPTDTLEYTHYDFKLGEHPDLIISFLGTNDYLNSIDEQETNVDLFADTYVEFVGNIRKQHPDARIYIMQALSETYCRREGIRTAAERIQQQYDNVFLIPSDTWDIEISSDGTHPTNEGLFDLTIKLKAYFEENLK